MSEGERQPVFNMPASVAGAMLVMIVLHVIRVALPERESTVLLLSLAFIPARYAGPTPGLPGGELSDVTSFITYMFVHGDTFHLVINTVWMLAFGSAVAKRTGDLGFVLFSLLCGLAGIVVHLALHFGETVPVVGASAAISGQMAGAIRMLYGAGSGIVPFQNSIQAVPLAKLGETLRNSRILLFLAIWIGINAAFGLMNLQFSGSGGGIAWEAHIGGFVCGLLAFGAFDRGPRIDESPHPSPGVEP